VRLSKVWQGAEVPTGGWEPRHMAVSVGSCSRDWKVSACLRCGLVLVLVLKRGPGFDGVLLP